MNIVEEIRKLKKQKDAVILAHYYVDDDVQEIADYIGDSYYLSKVAVDVKQKVILFCGVSFMGESAKILNPSKVVLMPDEFADCPMAHMARPGQIKKIREQYLDIAVVCYINSTAELKEHSDVCVTSANAMKIVKALPNKNIYFIPDQNLAHYIASKVPEKNFIFNDGYCHVHHNIKVEEIQDCKRKYPEAKVLIHPECPLEVLAQADYVGSTTGIIDYASACDNKEFIIVTERGVLYELKKRNPDKNFYLVNDKQICPNMKKITLEKVYQALVNGETAVEMEEENRKKASLPLEKMLELAK